MLTKQASWAGVPLSVIRGLGRGLVAGDFSKNLRFNIFSQIGPRLGCTVLPFRFCLYDLTYHEKSVQTLPLRLPCLELSSYVSPPKRLKAEAALIWRHGSAASTTMEPRRRAPGEAAPVYGEQDLVSPYTIPCRPCF